MMRLSGCRCVCSIQTTCMHSLTTVQHCYLCMQGSNQACSLTWPPGSHASHFQLAVACLVPKHRCCSECAKGACTECLFPKGSISLLVEVQALANAGCERRMLADAFRKKSPLRGADVRWVIANCQYSLADVCVTKHRIAGEISSI